MKTARWFACDIARVQRLFSVVFNTNAFSFSRESHSRNKLNGELLLEEMPSKRHEILFRNEWSPTFILGQYWLCANMFTNSVIVAIAMRWSPSAVGNFWSSRNASNWFFMNALRVECTMKLCWISFGRKIATNYYLSTIYLSSRFVSNSFYYYYPHKTWTIWNWIGGM